MRKLVLVLLLSLGFSSIASAATLPLGTCGTVITQGVSTGHQTDPATYAYAFNADPLSGNFADHKWVHVNAPNRITWDMGTPVNSAYLVPSIDHGPVPEEAHEATLYGSNDQINWTAGVESIVSLEGPSDWISDDYASLWVFQGGPYRYISALAGGPLLNDGDAEIDAICNTASYSNVNLCKLDTQGNPLPEWELKLSGYKFGSRTVLPNGNNYTIANVPAGDYVVQASGQYTYRPFTIGAEYSDAAYSKRDPADASYQAALLDVVQAPFLPWVRENNFPVPSVGHLGIIMNNAFTHWGSVFNTLHVYTLNTTTNAISDLSFKILDNNYTDNSGYLTIDLYGELTGTTGENGCVEFTNVLYGQYTVEETLKAGWVNFSGLGSVTVNDPTETFNVVNDNKGYLTVIKHVVNDNGGDAVASDFTMNVVATNPSDDSFPGAEAPGTTITLDAGDYTVDELANAGYVKTLSTDCSGTMEIGETKTCTITNNDTPGHFTGGGSVFPNNPLTILSGVSKITKDTRVTHGFTLHCDATKLPNRLEVNWGPLKNTQKFHLLTLNTAICTDNPNIDPQQPNADFNTITGTGTGRFQAGKNKEIDATIEFTFDDDGEPGKNDRAKMVITLSGGTKVLDIAGFLKLNVGNQQAHQDN